MDFPYRVSVIVPVYNQELFLHTSVESLLEQTISPSEMEIILVDDGSTDQSPSICDIYAEEFSNVVALHKKNGGVSEARNYGIEHAQGCYLMYLDADDALKPDTVASVVDFFDQHYDEVDLVLYPCYTVVDGDVEPLEHYRNTVLTETGIYDLQDYRNCYAGVTQMYICVKNNPGKNVLFAVGMAAHEDQRYCTDIILEKLCIGFCKQGGYLYSQHPDSRSSISFYSYYLFEPTMRFWEEEFAKYPDAVPRYLQALYVSDLNWKLCSNILFPYHYKEQDFAIAKNRIGALLERVETNIIIQHPNLDTFHRAYWLQEKPNCSPTVMVGGGKCSLLADGMVVHSSPGILVALRRSRVTKHGIELLGHPQNPSLQFMDKPELFARTVTNGKMEMVPVELSESSRDWYRIKEKVNKFWNFSYTLQSDDETSVEFIVRANGVFLPTYFYFAEFAIFSDVGINRNRFIVGCNEFYVENNVFYMRRHDVASAKQMQKEVDAAFEPREDRKLRRAARLIQNRGKRIWLYHDCHSVDKNNAYDQFIHDFSMKDGVERYYVIDDSLSKKRNLFSGAQMSHVIRFASVQHKALFLAAEKIIIAYAETSTFIPTSRDVFKEFSDIFHAEIIYLQHGVLHAHIPWMYSYDRLFIDKEVISTGFEYDNLTTQYGFPDDALICAGMPRYDNMDIDAPCQRKILFAPSWRRYLVTQDANDESWEPLTDQFLSSRFYEETGKLLNDKKLVQILEDYGYTLELKLHPIFAEFYGSFYSFDSPRICMASPSVCEEDYAVFITDFSSYRFDFVYLKRAIAYFFPDKDLFDSGVFHYRKTDLPLDGMFGDLAVDSDGLIEILDDILARDGKPKQEYDVHQQKCPQNRPLTSAALHARCANGKKRVPLAAEC